MYGPEVHRVDCSHRRGVDDAGALFMREAHQPYKASLCRTSGCLWWVYWVQNVINGVGLHPLWTAEYTGWSRNTFTHVLPRNILTAAWMTGSDPHRAMSLVTVPSPAYGQQCNTPIAT